MPLIFAQHITTLLQQRQKDIIADWDFKPAAVLVPLFIKEGHYHLLFTKRTDHLRQHPGQISFPGGRYDEADGSLQETVLREAEEEIGLTREHIKILGELDDMLTGTQYRIRPFVATITYPYNFRINETEITELIEIPLFQLQNPANLEIQQRVFYKSTIDVYYYHVWQEPIWGATARIIKHFLDVTQQAL